MTETLNRTRLTVQQALDIEPALLITEAALSDLNFDSLDRVHVLMDLEEEFRISITDETADGWRTFGDIVATVENRVTAR